MAHFLTIELCFLILVFVVLSYAGANLPDAFYLVHTLRVSISIMMTIVLGNDYCGLYVRPIWTHNLHTPHELFPQCPR